VKIVGAKVGSDAADHLHNGYGLDEFVEYEAADGQASPGEGVRPLTVFTNLDPPAESNTDWIAWPFTAFGPVRTSVVGDPKEGKTTYALALASSVIRGAQFLDRPATQMPVVYLSEQSQATFYRQMPPALKAHGEPGLYYVPFPNNFGFTWAEFVRGGIETCIKIESQLLIIDTVGKFSQLEDEADPGDVAGALRELDRAHSEGISVMILKHSRKSGGSITTAPAGSYKWNADVDHICYLTKPRGMGEHQRKLECIGRLDDAIGEWTLEYAPETREVNLLGDFEAVEELSIAELIREEMAVGEIVTPKEIAIRIVKDADSCRKAMNRKREWFEHLPEGKYKRKV
jgi:AAA domain